MVDDLAASTHTIGELMLESAPAYLPDTDAADVLAPRGGSSSRPARGSGTLPCLATDDGRMRRLTQSLPAEYAGRHFSAREQGASESELSAIAAEGLQEIYFKDGGRRASGLPVKFTDIDYIDFGLLSWGQAGRSGPRPSRRRCVTDSAVSAAAGGGGAATLSAAVPGRTVAVTGTAGSC